MSCFTTDRSTTNGERRRFEASGYGNGDETEVVVEVIDM
jgi:hypothetical protein